MLQPDPGKKRYSGTYRKNKKTGETVEVTPPTNPINFGKYGKFFAEEGNTVSGARSLKQLGNHYNTDAFKTNILPQLQELNPETDFFYEGNTYAYGGELTEFNEGGSHAENPEGGIPQGVGDNGKVNRVEEGETKLEDYVFSDRINLSMEDVQKFNLPSYVKGKSMAEATKMFNKKFEERKDNASQSTKDKFMKRTMAAQEEAKQEMMQASNNFSVGGLLSSAGDMAGGIASDQEAGKAGQEQSVGGAAAKYGLMGAAAGSIVPGIGTAIGAAGGAIIGGASAAIANNEAKEKQQDDAAKSTGKLLISDGYNNYKFFGGFRNEGTKTEGTKTETTSGEEDSPSFVNKGMAVAGGLASLAPVIGNIVAGAKLEQDDPNRFYTAGRTYQPTFADERGALNAVNEAYAGAKDVVADKSGGDLGAARAGARGVMASKAAAKLKAFDYTNRQNMEEQKAMNQDFTRAANEAANVYNQEQIANKQDRAAYLDAKDTYRNATLEGLSSMGNLLLTNSIGDSSYDIFGNKILSDEEKAAKREDRRKAREKARQERRKS